MHISHLLTFLYVLPIYSLQILLPAYSYPINGAWKPIWNQITAHPKVQFQIIINPDSGPGADQYPESDYITALTRLNKFPNVKLIGYVPTNYAKRPIADVIKEVDTYAGWASYTKSNITVSGIFFDEVTDSSAAAQKSYMKNISDHTYASFSTAKTSVVFNPGCVIDKSYFSMADIIVEFENPLSSYKGQTTINTFPKNFRNKTAIIAYNSVVGQTALKKMVQVAKSANVNSIYLTSDCCYNQVNGTLLNQLANAVAA